MKKFNEIYGKVMIEVSPVDIAMLGDNVPIVTLDGLSWAEFTTWAAKSFSPHIEVAQDCWMYDNEIRIRLIGSVTAKGLSALKTHFPDFILYSDNIYYDEGPSYDSSLYLKIPYVQSI